MLEFFHKERTYPVEPVNVEKGHAAFLTEEALSPEKVIKVTDSRGNIACVTVQNLRRTESGVWLCFSTVHEGVLEPQAAVEEPLRGEPRLDVGVRVRSESLPGFAALTHDLSPQGVQLLTEQPLPVGTRMSLTFDLDDDRGTLELLGVVRWCKLSPPCRSGLQFMKVSPAQAQRLQEYLTFRGSPDLVVPRLSESLSRMPADATTIETDAELIDGYRDEHWVNLRLRTERETLDFKFPVPTVHVSRAGHSRIGRITSEHVSSGTWRYSFHDEAGEIVLQLESAAPEVTMSRR